MSSAVKRVVRAECEASGSLAVREPEFKPMMHAPATINALTFLGEGSDT